MKKILIIVIAITLLVSVNFVLAAKGGLPNGRPFQAIWDAITGNSSSQCSECPPKESDWDEERIAELEQRVEDLENRECLPETTRSCDTQLSGICSTGTQTCGQDWMWEDCIADNDPVEEVCDDSLDNDCDGEVDEDCI